MKPICPKCLDPEAAVSVDLGDGESLCCAGCDQPYTVAEVREMIASWGPILVWLDAHPARVPAPTAKASTTCQGCGKDAGPGYVSHPMTDLPGTDGVNWGDTAMVLCDDCERATGRIQTAAEFVAWRDQWRNSAPGRGCDGPRDVPPDRLAARLVDAVRAG